MEACRPGEGKTPIVVGSPAALLAAGFGPANLGKWLPAPGALEVAERMYDWLIVILVGLAGYAEAPGWFILFGAFGLTIEGWWGRLGLLRHSPRALSSKKTAYFVAGAISNLGLAALGYLVGQVLRGLTP
jgi:hypothetical protein